MTGEELLKYYMDSLIGKQLTLIGRAGHLLIVEMGKSVSCISEDGTAFKRHEFCLHVEGKWRFSNPRENKIITADLDIYAPGKDAAPDAEVEPDELEDSLFDERMKGYVGDGSEKIFVEKCFLSPLGDLCLDFSNGDQLTAYVCTSEAVECWRLLEPATKLPHLVMTGKWIEEPKESGFDLSK